MCKMGQSLNNITTAVRVSACVCVCPLQGQR